MIYLASPYSNDPEGNYAAMLDVCKRLVARAPAPLVFSPVVYFHPFCQEVPYDRMLSLCFDMLQHAREFVIVALPGWMDSNGVGEETAFWYRKTQGIATLLDPVTLQRIVE